MVIITVLRDFCHIFMSRLLLVRLKNTARTSYVRFHSSAEKMADHPAILFNELFFSLFFCSFAPRPLLYDQSNDSKLPTDPLDIMISKKPEKSFCDRVK